MPPYSPSLPAVYPYPQLDCGRVPTDKFTWIPKRRVYGGEAGRHDSHLVLGGSTTFMWPFIKNPADSWVARLETKLQAISSKRVQVINGGINYGTSAEALAGLCSDIGSCSLTSSSITEAGTMSSHCFSRTTIRSIRISEAMGAVRRRDRERNESSPTAIRENICMRGGSSRSDWFL